MYDYSHVSTSMRPHGDTGNTFVSSSSNLTKDICVNYTRCSSAYVSISNQAPAEHEGSYSDSSLSQVIDDSSEYSSWESDNTLITMHDLSNDTVSNLSNSNCLLDLGLKNKGFRMGHLNIQGVRYKIDHVGLLLGSDKIKFMY